MTTHDNGRVRTCVTGILALFLVACGGADSSAQGEQSRSTSATPDRSEVAESSALEANSKPNAQLTAKALAQAETEAQKADTSQPLDSLPPGSIAPKAAYVSGAIARKADVVRIPAYRFYNANTGAHFYTISTAERDSVVATMPQFKYEGVAYHASQVGGQGLLPFYRFYVPSKGFHFYTSNPIEKASIQANLSATYSYEGIGYYVLNSDPQAPAPEPEPAPVPTTQAEAARFLTQATYGPNMAEIQNVASIGPAAWIEQQFITSSTDTHWNYSMVRRGQPGCTVCDASYINAVMESFWWQAVRGPDQLRQRTAFALSELFVVSNVNSSIDSITAAHASYLDMLSRNAFGNFRTLLQDVSTHPAMASYLSHLRNEKEDAVTGRLPDENFAREVMQLFSIGLWQLNQDGTRVRDSNGNSIPTYNNEDVMGLAKVFTGWSWNGPDRSDNRWHGWGVSSPDSFNWQQQLQNYPKYHSTSEKRFLGRTIPAGTSGDASLQIAIDTLFNHPNTGPFIGKQLIQRLVTSNPSPAYVGRVAAAFNNNGSGVRGDMRAVLRSILLDAEARDASYANQGNWGKLREPMVRFATWMRAFNARSAHGAYRIWNLEDNVSSLGQNPLRAPSVFNWFRPDYAPPGPILNSSLVAPEFQITHETTTTGYANFVIETVERGFGWNNTAIIANYAPEIALANNPAQLLDRLNLLLTAGRMTPATRQVITNAVNAVPASNAAGRVHTAVALIMLSPEFIVQK